MTTLRIRLVRWLSRKLMPDTVEVYAVTSGHQHQVHICGDIIGEIRQGLPEACESLADVLCTVAEKVRQEARAMRTAATPTEAD